MFHVKHTPVFFVKKDTLVQYQAFFVKKLVF